MFTVNKKTDLKFFENTSNGYKNIPMGTVIDQDVISPDVFEFYLQCPDVDRGTASPVHFLCIHNDNEDLSINDFEDISYKQSFYYWNWPGPVRIPAALKYAEVANAFSSRNLTHEIKSELKDSPYYI
jgi:aubergine-like protein